MFEKVLLVEDYQDTNRGIVEMLHERFDFDALQEELYCDKAFNRIRVALAQNKPYDLLLTDFYFNEDHVAQQIKSGLDLIRKVREVQPSLKIIVNSREDNPVKVNGLFKDQGIQAFVCKGRDSLRELETAIREVYHNRTYVSPQIKLNVANNVFELDDFDRRILNYLADGLTKKEISEKLKKEAISPNSESSIDKKISRLFDGFGAKNTSQLLVKLVREGKI
jgi:DNA-binding NarL/FixJ family response regulator